MQCVHAPSRALHAGRCHRGGADPNRRRGGHSSGPLGGRSIPLGRQVGLLAGDMEKTTSLLITHSGSDSALAYDEPKQEQLEQEPEPEPEQEFGTGPDGRPVFIGTGGLDGAKAQELDDLTRIGAVGGTRPYRAIRRAAVSAGLDLASSDKGYLQPGDVVQVAEIVVYAGRTRVRFQPSVEGGLGGWASVRSGGGRELLRPLNREASSSSQMTGKGLWATPRERAIQLLCGVHGLNEELSTAMLERPVAHDGAAELTDDEWCEALCEMGSAEVRDLASLAEQKLQRSAAIDEELELASSALIAGDYAAAKKLFGSVLVSCESATLERCAVERAQAAATGLEQADKGLKFAGMSEDALMQAHAQVIDDETMGHKLGIVGGGGKQIGQYLNPAAPMGELPTTTAPTGPAGRPRAPLEPYPGPSRPTASMFSLYWRMPKGEPPPIGFELECVFIRLFKTYLNFTMPSRSDVQRRPLCGQVRLSVQRQMDQGPDGQFSPRIGF